MSPKKLLKHKLCRSNIEEFDEGTSFKRLLPETEKNLVSDNNIKRVIFCSGQVYYDLYETRQQRNIDNIAIIRLEQLAPFPFDLVMNELKRYPQAELVWVQEESMNHGGWSYIEPRFETCMRHALGKEKKMKYIGRGTTAAPATGFKKIHQLQLDKFIDEAFTL